MIWSAVRPSGASMGLGNSNKLAMKLIPLLDNGPSKVTVLPETEAFHASIGSLVQQNGHLATIGQQIRVHIDYGLPIDATGRP